MRPLYRVTIVSVVRLYFLNQHLTDTSPDANFSLGFCVSSIECNLAIITACGPTMWPLLRLWAPGVFGSSGPSYGPYRRKKDEEDAPWMRSAGVQGPKDSQTPRKKSSAGDSSLSATVGANSFDLKELEHQDELKNSIGNWEHVQAHVPAAHVPEDSDEEMLAHHGIGSMRSASYRSDVRENQSTGTVPRQHGRELEQ
jgi:hypothetical protein